MNAQQITTNPFISPNSVVVISSDQISSDLAGESVILQLKSGIYYGLNEVGSVIWQLINEPKTVQSLYDAVLAEYEVDTQTCENDVQVLLRDLLEAQLIEIRES
jgi:hypothetical protein